MSKGILVCVTAQRECGRLIRAGAALAREKNEPLLVFHVSTSRQMSAANRAETLNLLYALSREAGADMETVEADPPADAILARCGSGAFSTVILGKGPGGVSDALTRALGEDRVLVL